MKTRTVNDLSLSDNKPISLEQKLTQKMATGGKTPTCSGLGADAKPRVSQVVQSQNSGGDRGGKKSEKNEDGRRSPKFFSEQREM